MNKSIRNGWVFLIALVLVGVGLGLRGAEAQASQAVPAAMSWEEIQGLAMPEDADHTGFKPAAALPSCPVAPVTKIM